MAYKLPSILHNNVSIIIRLHLFYEKLDPSFSSPNLKPLCFVKIEKSCDHEKCLSQVFFSTLVLDTYSKPIVISDGKSSYWCTLFSHIYNHETYSMYDFLTLNRGN